MFADEVFVFTPGGDVIKPPRRGLTPIDFAYAIHSGVATVWWAPASTGASSPSTTCCKNGDIVEVRTSKNAPGPQPRLAAAGQELLGPHEDQAVVQKGAARGEHPYGRTLFEAEMRRKRPFHVRHNGRGRPAGNTEKALRAQHGRAPTPPSATAADGRAQRQPREGRALAHPQTGEAHGARQDQRAGRKARRPPAEGRARHIGGGAGATASSSSPSAARPSPGTTSWASSPAAAASPSTARTVRTTCASG